MKGKQTMETFTRYDDVPETAMYLGSENGDGSMSEALADEIDNALELARLTDADGVHYFDLRGFE